MVFVLALPVTCTVARAAVCRLEAVTFEMVRQWNMEPTGISEAMAAGLRGNMSRYMEHLRATRSWSAFMLE